MNKNIPTIISVGGSIIIPETGFDIRFLKRFRSLILKEIRKGRRFVLVIGGGATCRQYQRAAARVRPLNDIDLDWIGIHTTLYNAQFVKYLFKDEAFQDVVQDPRKKIKTNKPIIVAAGWKPGASTDMDTVLMAQTYGAKELINLSNIEYVYDADPKKHKHAKKIEQIDWQSFRKHIVGMGKHWEPGQNLPFDPIASALAQKLGLRVRILDGTNISQVERAISGKPFKGTVIW